MFIEKIIFICHFLKSKSLAHLYLLQKQENYDI